MRKKKFEQLLEIEYLDSKYKKPNKKITSLFSSDGRSIVVIGDKFFTDGLLAIKISARFIKIDRKSDGKEPFLIKFSYMIDNIAWFFWRSLFIHKKNETSKNI